MITLNAMYPRTDDSTFDFDYYANTHTPIVVNALGDAIVRATLTTGEAFGGGPSPYMCVATIEIDSIESLAAAFAAHGGEIMGDIPNFTNVQPTMYVGTVV